MKKDSGLGRIDVVLFVLLLLLSDATIFSVAVKHLKELKEFLSLVSVS